MVYLEDIFGQDFTKKLQREIKAGGDRTAFLISPAGDLVKRAVAADYPVPSCSMFEQDLILIGSVSRFPPKGMPKMDLAPTGKVADPEEVVRRLVKGGVVLQPPRYLLEKDGLHLGLFHAPIKAQAPKVFDSGDVSTSMLMGGDWVGVVTDKATAQKLKGAPIVFAAGNYRESVSDKRGAEKTFFNFNACFVAPMFTRDEPSAGATGGATASGGAGEAAHQAPPAEPVAPPAAAPPAAAPPASAAALVPAAAAGGPKDEDVNPALIRRWVLASLKKKGESGSLTLQEVCDRFGADEHTHKMCEEQLVALEKSADLFSPKRGCWMLV